MIIILLILVLLVLLWDLVEICVRNIETNEVFEKKKGSLKFNKIDNFKK